MERAPGPYGIPGLKNRVAHSPARQPATSFPHRLNIPLTSATPVRRGRTARPRPGRRAPGIGDSPQLGKYQFGRTGRKIIVVALPKRGLSMPPALLVAADEVIE